MNELIDCKSIRNLLATGGEPDAEILDHLEGCEACLRFQKTQTALTDLLRRLPSVEAPGDFTNRVKMRIAQGRPVSSMNGFDSYLKILIPAAAVLLLGMLMFGGLFSDGNERPESTEQAVRSVDEESTNPTGRFEIEKQSGSDPSGPEETNVISERPSIKDEASKATSGNERRDKSVPQKDQTHAVNEEDRSIDLAVRPGRTINPPGLDPNRPINNKKPEGVERNFTGIEVLSELGIETAIENGVWNVSSVRPNSIAEKAGVLQGDEIRSLDGEALSTEPIYGRSVSGKELRVLRNGNEKIIRITPLN